MVCTRSQGRVPLAEVNIGHLGKRKLQAQTRAQSPLEENTNETEYDESRENYPPDHNPAQHICSTPKTPRTPKTGIYHTEWLTSPFWRQALTYDHVNRWESSADEIIVKIFSYLKFEDLFRCALVCRHWRDLSYDVLLWTKFNLTQRSVPVDRLLCLLNNGTRYLSLSCGVVKAPVLQQSKHTKYSLQLEYADFGLCNISPVHLTTIVVASPCLVKLNLESLSVSGGVLRAVSQCPNIRILNMAMCQNVPPAHLIAVTRNCTQLEELNLAWCNLSEHTFNRLFPVKCGSMLKLNVSGGRDTVSCETVRHLTTQLPNLRSLDISDCFKINREALTHIAENCPRLRELSFSRVYELLSSDVLEWLVKMPHISHLNTFPSIVTELFRRFRLDIAKYSNVTLNSKDKSEIARPCTKLKIPKGTAVLWEVVLR